MGRQHPSMKRATLLFCCALFFFASFAIGQATTQETTTTRPSTGASSAQTSAASSQTSVASTTSTRTTTTPSSTQTTTTATSTGTSTSVAASSGSDDNESVPPLPTLKGSYNYPAPAVPPTNNAPFMKPNSVPEGTFFIAVGAILGAFGAAILIWRAIVACLLHRSVKNAALAQTAANDKASFPPPPAPFYKYTDHESSPSLANASTGRGVRRTQRGPIPSSTPSQTNLFFSPTAPGANTNSNRESRFLPSGFYAAGSGAASQQGHGHSISLSNLRPDSRGHPRAVGHSPPDSPGLMPQHANNSRRNLSTSTLNVNRPISGRAPSAFLEDLLDDQPEQFPPAANGGNPQAWNQQSRY